MATTPGRLAEGSRTGRSRSARSRRARRNAFAGLAFVAPALVLFGMFVAYPVADTIRLSLYDWNGLDKALFIGVDNFKELINRDPYFPKAVWNTLIWTAVTVPVQMLVGLSFALILDRGFRGRVLFRSIFFLPGVMSSLIVSFAWGWIYNPEIGVLNGFFRAVGLPDQQWLAEPGKALWASMALSVWRYSGFWMVFYLAGLQLIPPSLYEAARVDGASLFMQLRRITLPLLKPMTGLIALLAMINALREFEVVYLLTRGGPAHSTDLLSIQVFDQAFALSRDGYGAAIATFMLAMIAICSVLALWMLGRAHRSVAS